MLSYSINWPIEKNGFGLKVGRFDTLNKLAQRNKCITESHFGCIEQKSNHLRVSSGNVEGTKNE